MTNIDPGCRDLTPKPWLAVSSRDCQSVTGELSQEASCLQCLEQLQQQQYTINTALDAPGMNISQLNHAPARYKNVAMQLTVAANTEPETCGCADFGMSLNSY